MMSRFIVTTRPLGKEYGEITSNCFKILNLPVTKLSVNSDFTPSELMEYEPDIAIFTSTFGAQLILESPEIILKPGTQIIAIGSKTSEILSNRYSEVIVPQEQTSKGVITVLRKSLRGKERVALFVSSRTNGLIDRYLSETGIDHLTIELYDAEILPGKDFVKHLTSENCFGLIVTSSFEARVIFNGLLKEEDKRTVLSRCHIFAVGKTTADALSKLGITVSHPVGNSDIGKLVAEIEKIFCSSK